MKAHTRSSSATNARTSWISATDLTGFRWSASSQLTLTQITPLKQLIARLEAAREKTTVRSRLGGVVATDLDSTSFADAIGFVVVFLKIHSLFPFPVVNT